MPTFNTILATVAALVTAAFLFGCTMPASVYRPSPWTTVGFEQAKAQCSAQMDRDMDRAETLQTSFNMMMDTGSRVESCLRGYGYVAVR